MLGSFGSTYMKTLLLFAIIVSIAATGRAQPVIADSVVLSLFPIRWDFSFTADINTSDPNYEHMRLEWTDVIDKPIGRVTRTGLDYAIELACADTFIDSGLYIDQVSFSLDTVSSALRNLTIGMCPCGHEMFSYNGYGSFEADSVPFSLDSSGKRMSAILSDGLKHYYGISDHGQAWFQSYAANQSSGWVTTGGASPPLHSSVKEVLSKQPLFARLTSYSTQFYFQPSALATLAIFDLLGREVARIDVPSGAESAELNTSHLAPGLYIAQMGTQAVKFVVR
jgi:hypothetical protein